MKFLRRLSINVMILLISILCFSFTASAVSFDEINSSTIFLKQSENDTCTLAAATMLVRRAAYASGNTNWSAITENSMRSTAWVEGTGLRFNFTYAGITVSDGTMSGDTGNTTKLISLLNSHPEGIVIYDYQVPHAILVTDYTNGQFYCADPARNVASGRIPISLASISVNNADAYWYVSSPSVSVSGSTSGSGSGSGDSGNNENPTVSGMETISRPSEIDALENQDIGMIFNKAKWDSRTTITVPERGWVIMDTTYNPWMGGIAVYMNPSLTKVAKRFSNGTVGTFARCGFYLEKGTYYVQPYDGGGGNVSFSDNLKITIYAYYIPSSSVLSAKVSLSPDRSFATLHCTSTMGTDTLYRWVKDVSITDNIKDENFYSNKSVIGDIDVEENGTYSVQISSNNQEWENYPVDVQIIVSDIVPKPKECEHEYKTVIDQEPTCAETGSQHQECTICGHKEAATEIPATGNHTYGDWAVVEQATTTKQGTKQRICSVCRMKETAAIEKLAETEPNKTDEADMPAGNGFSGTNTPGGNVSSGASVPSESLKTIKVKLNSRKKVTARKGQKLKVKITGISKKKKVTFKSSNKKVVAVNSKGMIKAKKSGKTTITIKCGKKKAKIIITVKK